MREKDCAAHKRKRIGFIIIEQQQNETRASRERERAWTEPINRIESAILSWRARDYDFVYSLF